ncbi:MAG: hypothetical protein JO126_02435 [Alphaproteobacteria bacterium]|nr:hypothetical protein [Alphaproteobacteria bacterium]
MPTNDLPITNNGDDLYGFDPFANAIATSVKKMSAPEGVVIAINGLWGSGKTSVLNLIAEKLKDNDQIEVAPFNPWWFSTSEALTLGFLNDMHVLLGKSLGDQAKEIFRKFDSLLGATGKIIELAGDAVVPGAGKVVAATTKIGMKGLEGLVSEDTLPKLFAKISDLLKASEKRYVVIIDDIDRLPPDEALQLFRLIKSVGRLPNVIYILAYDRVLAEKLIQEKFPSEGPHYLDKIVQAAFEVPPITNDDLRDQFMKELGDICKKPDGEDEKYFYNVMYGAVTPGFTTPRDIKRLLGMLEVTWPAVQDELNRADFVALEAIRLKYVALYKALRDNPGLLTGTGRSTGRDKQDIADMCNQAFLTVVPPSDREAVRTSLMRIFPRLQSVWGNLYYDDSRNQTWTRDRNVCSRKFFSAYFRLDVSGDVLSRKEVASIIAVAGDEAALTQKFLDGIQTKMKSGRSKASVMLDELTLSADDIKEADAPVFLKTVLGLYEKLWLASDKARGMMAIEDNRLRLHWLLNALRPRFTVKKRNELLTKALSDAPTACLLDFAERMDSEQKPSSNGTVTPEDERFVDAATAEALVKLAAERVEADANNNLLGKIEDLMRFLYAVRRMLPNGAEEVLKITSSALKDDDFVLNLAFSSVGQTWSQGMGMIGLGDLVAVGKSKINKTDISNVADLDVFMKRLIEVRDGGKLSADQQEGLKAFFQLWDEAGEVEAA